MGLALMKKNKFDNIIIYFFLKYIKKTFPYRYKCEFYLLNEFIYFFDLIYYKLLLKHMHLKSHI